VAATYFVQNELPQCAVINCADMVDDGHGLQEA
jgi:hypothetical protein